MKKVWVGKGREGEKRDGKREKTWMDVRQAGMAETSINTKQPRENGMLR